MSWSYQIFNSFHPLLPVTRTRKVFEGFHRLMDEMYGYKSFQLAMYCNMGFDRGRVLSFNSYCCSWWHSNALRKRNIRRNTIKRCSSYSVLPINQSDPRQIWFELCCPAELTVIMSGRLLTKWPNHGNFFTTYKFISSWFWNHFIQGNLRSLALKWNDYVLE